MMPRGLSAAAKSYAGPVTWLAEITTGTGAKHYFAEDKVAFGVNAYQPYLRIAQGPRFNRSLQADYGEIELLNADLFVSALLEAEAFEGALCELKQLLLGIDEAVLILRGRLTEQEESDSGVTFRLVSELDPGQIELHARAYAQLCTWRFAKPSCGYDAAASSWTQNLSETAADIVSLFSVGNSGLAMVVNTHQDRVVLITAGAGKGQKRRIRSNTATTLTVGTPWAVLPDSTSKFAVYSISGGAPKALLTVVSTELSALARSADARSVGSVDLAMAVDEHKGDLVRIISGVGAGQQRKIGSNTATVITLEAGEPDFSPAPVAEASVFAVFYRACPKDYAPSCEERARTEAFNGFPTLVPLVTAALADGDPTNLPPGLNPGDIPGGGPGLPPV